MSVYHVPEEYFFRIHQCRPKFKNDYENILLFLTSGISDLPELEKDEFYRKFDEIVCRYGKNAKASAKTHDNWKTEISSLFGFLQYSEEGKIKPGRITKMLAERQDFVEFFKVFMFTFQYPGAHIAKHKVLEQICNGVKFKPARYIISVLDYAEKNNKEKNRPYITKAEVCHCIFNDLRCTRDKESPDKVWKRIIDNRKNKVSYDETGDVIRYAGDILDYMVFANILTNHKTPNYYLNVNRERKTIDLFLKSKLWFGGYDKLYSHYEGKTYESLTGKEKELAYSVYDNQKKLWFDYVNQELKNIDLRTKLSSVMPIGSIDYANAMEKEIDRFFIELQDKGKIKTKETGNYGEDRIYLYEYNRVKKRREDILHIIQPIPTQFSVGYDLQSVEVNHAIQYKKRYIEVKTSVLNTEINKKNIGFHLTKNEISTADTVGEHYYVYRLIVNKTTGSAKLYIIKNPMKLFREGRISMTDGNGANVSFNPDDRNVCSFEEFHA